MQTKKLSSLAALNLQKSHAMHVASWAIQRLVRDAVEVILNDKLRKKIKKIILFGSMVTNEMTVRSDIDLAVLFDRIGLREATKFRIRVLGELNDKLDVQVFNILPNKIKKEIEKKYNVLYHADK